MAGMLLRSMEEAGRPSPALSEYSAVVVVAAAALPAGGPAHPPPPPPPPLSSPLPRQGVKQRRTFETRQSSNKPNSSLCLLFSGTFLPLLPSTRPAVRTHPVPALAVLADPPLQSVHPVPLPRHPSRLPPSVCAGVDPTRRCTLRMSEGWVRWEGCSPCCYCYCCWRR